MTAARAQAGAARGRWWLARQARWRTTGHGFAHLQGRDRARVFDHLEATEQVATRIVDRLAVLERDEVSDLVLVLAEERLVAKEEPCCPRANERRSSSPRGRKGRAPGGAGLPRFETDVLDHLGKAAAAASTAACISSCVAIGVVASTFWVDGSCTGTLLVARDDTNWPLMRRGTLGTSGSGSAAVENARGRVRAAWPRMDWSVVRRAIRIIRVLWSARSGTRRCDDCWGEEPPRREGRGGPPCQMGEC
jgi:hypothetical protein